MRRTLHSFLPVSAILLGLGLASASLAGPPAGRQPIFPLAKKAGFNTLAKAVQAAGLQGTLTSGGPFTVFAPTDEAFAALPAGVLDNLLADPEALRNVLLYHVVSGEVKAADVVGLSSATALNNGTIGIKVMGDSVYLDDSTTTDARVTQTDVLAGNGVIHVIDKVLIPGN